MKISKKALKRIIKEELQAIINEDWGESPEQYMAGLGQRRKTEIDPKEEATLEIDWVNQLEDPGSWTDCQKEGRPGGTSRERCWELEDERENFIRGNLGKEELPHRPVSEGKKS